MGRKLWLCVLLITVQLCMGGQVKAGILNGGFELPDPTDPNKPRDWNTFNYVARHSQFTPQPEHEQIISWDIPAPVEGDYFVLLSTGDIVPDVPDNGIIMAKAWQNISFNTGDIIYGFYFFGTCDYARFFDKADIWLLSDPNNLDPDGIIEEIGLIDVGSYGSTDGWQRFFYEFKAEDVGKNWLVLTVADDNDDIYKSYFAVDGLVICTPPAYGDAYQDCKVDLMDYNFLAYQWLCDCSATEPNDLPDPCDCPWVDLGGGDIKVLLDADFDGDKIVDTNDLNLLGQYWLEGN